jgi:rSAM/selenodomain-associated transferase 1
MTIQKWALIFVCRYPGGGSIKTRLAKAIGEKRAINLYTAFLKDVFLWAEGSDEFDLLISLADGRHRAAFSEDFGIPLDMIYPQPQGDFGDRLFSSLKVAFERGYQQAAVAASDAPELSHDRVVAAFNGLDDHDISIIPAPDGGYSLLALKARIDLFHGVTWSTPLVLDETLKIARAGKWRVALLPPVADIDQADDLERLRGLLTRSAELRLHLPNTTSHLLGGDQ